jgi:polyhydroxybutyrate depolymerase
MKKWILRIFWMFFAIFFLVSTGLLAAFLIANKTNGAIESSGQTRRYLLYVPDTYDPAVPTPLVISMHGFAEWPDHQRTISHWNALADEFGFIVVYPSGTQFPMRWRTMGQPGSETDPMLDVTFISNLIDHLEAEYNIDAQRIYATGLSNGGGMSFVLSCMLSDRIAAIGTVAGAYTLPWSECIPSRQVPAIIFHGTEDPIVPYHGGPSRSFDIPFPDLPTWVGELSRRNGCTGAPMELPAAGEVSGIQYSPCAEDANVIFYTIAGGGHSWPGGQVMPRWIVGHTTMDIDATRVMWAFFQEHPLAGK